MSFPVYVGYARLGERFKGVVLSWLVQGCWFVRGVFFCGCGGEFGWLWWIWLAQNVFDVGVL